MPSSKEISDRGYDLLNEELFADIDYMSPAELTDAIVKTLSMLRNSASWGKDNAGTGQDLDQEITLLASTAMPFIFFTSFLGQRIWPRFIEIIEDDLEAAEGDTDFVKAVNELSWFMFAVFSIPKRCSNNTYFLDHDRQSTRSLSTIDVIPLVSKEDSEADDDGKTSHIRHTINDNSGKRTDVIMTKHDHLVLQSMLGHTTGAWMILVERDVATAHLDSAESLLDYVYNCDDIIGDISFTSDLNDSNTRLLERFLDI